MRNAIRAAITAAAAITFGATPALADWNGTIAEGQGGSHVIGNPAAKLKLTEFVSYTCPHCADFHKASDGALRVAYIPQGKVSVEVRHLVRDPIDLTAAILANCGEPRRFYAKHNAFLQTQAKWLPKAGKASAAQKLRWSTGPVPQRLRAIASDFGFYAIMQSNGLDRVATDACLANEALARRLLDMTDAAVAAGVTGTPSFMLNGTLLKDIYGWDTLEPELKSRLAAGS